LAYTTIKLVQKFHMQPPQKLDIFEL